MKSALDNRQGIFANIEVRSLKLRERAEYKHMAFA